jgi:hypothetical protein
MTNYTRTASRECCRGGRTLDGQSTAGEAYESIGVDGNHVVLAIGTSCGIRWRPCHVP